MSLIMLFNKIQDSVDLSEFLKLPEAEVNRIIKDTPEHIIDIIAKVMKGMCVHINASEEETEQCIRKVRERNMGYLFENAEKMDIQAERRKTAEAREQIIKVMIETSQELGADRKRTADRVMERFELTQEMAEEKMKLFWKE